MKLRDDHEVEEPEQVTRFACGALLGALFGLLLVLVCAIESLVGAAFVFLLPMMGFGLLALYFGDRFWMKVLECLVWFK